MAVSEIQALGYLSQQCEQIAAECLAASKRFEANTGQEAPPHIGVLRGIALDTAVALRPNPAQRWDHEHVCPCCGVTFKGHPLRTYCSKLCQRNQKERRDRDNGMESVKRARQARLCREYPTPAACSSCGDTYEAKSATHLRCKDCAVAYNHQLAKERYWESSHHDVERRRKQREDRRIEDQRAATVQRNERQLDRESSLRTKYAPACELRAAGLGYRTIADHLGLNRNAVRSYMRRHVEGGTPSRSLTT